MAAIERVNWPTYAISRLREHDVGSPTSAVVGILGYVAENEVPGVGEHERAMCAAWLARLVDKQGNPLDDKLRGAWEQAAEENAINSRGSLSMVVREDDRVEVRIAVLRRAAAEHPREKLRATMLPHFEGYVDHLLDALYEEPTDGGRLPAPSERQVKATEGWTPLEFYAYIIRSLGLPARFHFDGKGWVGKGPFTKPVPQSILDLLEAQGV